MALIVQLSFAQQNTISGTVSDENGLPLLGATTPNHIPANKAKIFQEKHSKPPNSGGFFDL